MKRTLAAIARSQPYTIRSSTRSGRGDGGAEEESAADVPAAGVSGLSASAAAGAAGVRAGDAAPNRCSIPRASFAIARISGIAWTRSRPPSRSGSITCSGFSMATPRSPACRSRGASDRMARCSPLGAADHRLSHRRAHARACRRHRSRAGRTTPRAREER